MANTPKSKRPLPSRQVLEGPQRAPNRSYLYAMGLSEADMELPFVGIVDRDGGVDDTVNS